MMILARAPLRISLGGGTDFLEEGAENEQLIKMIKARDLENSKISQASVRTSSSRPFKLRVMSLLCQVLSETQQIGKQYLSGRRSQKALLIAQGISGFNTKMIKDFSKKFKDKDTR